MGAAGGGEEAPGRVPPAGAVGVMPGRSWPPEPPGPVAEVVGGRAAPPAPPAGAAAGRTVGLAEGAEPAGLAAGDAGAVGAEPTGRGADAGADDEAVGLALEEFPSDSAYGSSAATGFTTCVGGRSPGAGGVVPAGFCPGNTGLDAGAPLPLVPRGRFGSSGVPEALVAGGGMMRDMDVPLLQ